MTGRGILPSGRRKPPKRQGRRAGPAVPGRPLEHRYHDFDTWLTLGTALSAHYDAVVACVEAFEAEDRPPPPDVNPTTWVWSEAPEKRLKRRQAMLKAAEALLLKFSAEELAAAVAEFGAGSRWFESDDNYQGSGDRRTVSVGFVTAMVATLIGAFPSGSPSSPAVFTRMMIEELIAPETTASRIECAIRTLIRTRTFLPAIAEVLGAIRDAQVAVWGEGGFEVDDGEPMILWARRALEKMVARAKAPRLPGPGSRDE